MDEKLKLFDQNKGEAETKKLEIYNQEVQLKQRIKELQKSQYESNNKIQQRKREIEELDKKLDNGMPNGCAKALRFLEDYCQRHKVGTHERSDHTVNDAAFVLASLQVVAT